jgi:hypothetical protein
MDYSQKSGFEVNDGALTLRISEDALAKDYSGKALVIADDAILPKSSSGPRIILDQYTYDCGPLGQNEQVNVAFGFRNEGNGDLLIDSIKSTCTCIGSVPSKAPIPAGQSGSISVKFATGSVAGMQEQSLYVRTNDRTRSWIRLTLKALVKARLRVVPSTLAFDRIITGKTAMRHITVVSPEEKSDLVVRNVGSKFITTGEITSARFRGYALFNVPIKVAADAPIGHMDTYIQFEVRGTSSSDIRMPIVADITGPITVVPEKAFFGIVKAGERVTLRLQIENSGEQDIIIPAVSRQCQDGIAYKIIQKVPGKMYQLEVELLPETMPGAIQRTIVLHTDSQVQPIINVRVGGLSLPR